ncbi:hypothetical protein BKA62DRAFT_678276 [Auriculariales sp. MPI-PUGE-AT-0066]|nr:hypothetical protein BKA62DRAFT_678276 [Auriculariales sp. MPI-PUGE-AT-0066]
MAIACLPRLQCELKLHFNPSISNSAAYHILAAGGERKRVSSSFVVDMSQYPTPPPVPLLTAVELDLISNTNLPPPELLSKYTTIEYTLSRLLWFLPPFSSSPTFVCIIDKLGIGIRLCCNGPRTSHTKAARAFLILASQASSTGRVYRADAPLTRVGQLLWKSLDVLFLPAAQLVPAHREDNSNNQPVAASYYQISCISISAFTMCFEPNELIALRDAVVPARGRADRRKEVLFCCRSLAYNITPVGQPTFHQYSGRYNPLKMYDARARV